MSNSNESGAGHTPGPWVFERHAPESRYFGNIVRLWVEDGRNYVTTITCQLNWQSEEVNIANARLIAAAPDLLALVERYASECGECGGKGWIVEGEAIVGRGPDDVFPVQVHCHECADIRAALSKAKGAQS